MGQIHFSKEESRVLGMKLGRSHLEKDGTSDLVEEMIREEYDCCIIKTSANLRDQMFHLQKMNMPVFNSGVVRRYRINYREGFQLKPYSFSNWVEELYDGTQLEILRELVNDIFYDEPIKFFNIPIYGHLVTKEQELECLFLYLKEFDNVLRNGTTKRMFLFLNAEGKYIGLTAMIDIPEEEHGDSVLSGILPAYRGKKLYGDIIKFIENDHFSRGFDYGICGARIQNIAAQKAFSKEDLYVTHYEYTYYIFPLLNRTEQSIIKRSISFKDISEMSFIMDLFELLRKEDSLNKLSTWNLKQTYKILKGKIKKGISYELSVSFPIFSDEEIIIVIKIHNNNDLISIYQFHFAK